MIQRGQHLRLQREAREPLGIVGEAIGKDFDGDVAINWYSPAPFPCSDGTR
jgi:hypothetical protein